MLFLFSSAHHTFSFSPCTSVICYPKHHHTFAPKIFIPCCSAAALAARCSDRRATCVSKSGAATAPRRCDAGSLTATSSMGMPAKNLDAIHGAVHSMPSYPFFFNHRKRMRGEDVRISPLCLAWSAGHSHLWLGGAYRHGSHAMK